MQLLKPARHRKKTSQNQPKPSMRCYHFPSKQAQPATAREPGASPWTGIPHRTSPSIKLLEFNLCNHPSCQQCPHRGFDNTTTLRVFSARFDINPNICWAKELGFHRLYAPGYKQVATTLKTSNNPIFKQ